MKDNLSFFDRRENFRSRQTYLQLVNSVVKENLIKVRKRNVDLQRKIVALDDRFQQIEAKIQQYKMHYKSK